jgi:hypothetical protein
MNKMWIRSKMTTRVQKHTAWAPWIKNLAEMLEPHLAEIKHQGESKSQHPEPLAHTKLLHTTLYWENRRAPTTTKCQLQTWLGDIWHTKQGSWWATKLISGTWGQHINLNCHTPLRKQMTKQLPLKDRRKKQNTPGETTIDLQLKYQQDGMLDE